MTIIKEVARRIACDTNSEMYTCWRIFAVPKPGSAWPDHRKLVEDLRKAQKGGKRVILCMGEYSSRV